MKKTFGALAVAIAAVIFAAPSFAANVVVKELNKGPDGFFVFEPQLVTIKPGDTVTFVADDKGHDVQSLPGMIPAGAQPFAGKMSQNATVTFTTPGVYVYKCQPHLALGMVGVIVVGSPANLAQIDASKLPPMAQKRVAGLLQQIKTSTASAR
ncbi:MAG: pseudoazurin [Alphaproteobacteria bacterium]|nr:pseudoazurin [Alphaproteobacteria bacterium]